MRPCRILVALVIGAALAMGCGGVTTLQPVLVGRASDAPSEALVARLVEAARTRGYDAHPIQPRQGRFALRARYTDALGSYTLAIECFQDGLVSITPIGPRVQRRRAFYVLPAALRAEILELARVLEAAARRTG